MATWITANIGNIVVSLILIAIVASVITKLIKDKKSSRPSCGGNCAHCGMFASCGLAGKKDE